MDVTRGSGHGKNVCETPRAIGLGLDGKLEIAFRSALQECRHPTTGAVRATMSAMPQVDGRALLLHAQEGQGNPRRTLPDKLLSQSQHLLTECAAERATDVDRRPREFL